MIATTDHRPTLVLGGTGKTGRRLVERLRRQDVPVRVGSRANQPPFDWERPDTWRPVLDGARAAYVNYAPDIGAPGATEAIAAFVDEALDAGVRRLVLLSGRGEEGAAESEHVLVRSGADWTILRSSWFAQNFSESYLLDPILAGTLALPAGDVGEPFVDADDIADVAAAVLTADGHIGEAYELTGPRLLTFADAVATIGEATGRPIEYLTISAEEFSAALLADGVPTDVVEFLAYLFGAVLDGRNASLADGVPRVLGRPARDFADYARATAAAGVWTPGRAA
jgi:uncharacterized protein YbjT (DUF2867 family)